MLVKRLAIGLVLGLVLGLAGVAEAHSSCHEVSKVMGYSHCRRFGTWSIPFSVFTELGASVLHFDLDGVSDAMRAAGVSPKLSATVGTWRTAVSIAWFYTGDEIAIGGVTSGPRLTSGTAPIVAFAAVQPSDTTGFVIQDALFAGARTHEGPLTIGAELAFGFRIADSKSPVLPAPMYETVGGSFLFQARAKADVWLTTWLTVGAVASISVLDPHDVGLGVTFGFHLMPYDATR